MFQSSLNIAKIQKYLTDAGCEWKFIPPGSPNFGGLWEKNEKSHKKNTWFSYGHI
jgi:hypothetical protein